MADKGVGVFATIVLSTAPHKNMVLFIDTLSPTRARHWAEKQRIPFVFHSPHVLAQWSFDQFDPFCRPHILSDQTYAVCPGLGYWVTRLSGDEEYARHIAQARRQLQGTTIWLDTPLSLGVDALSQKSWPSLSFWSEDRKTYQEYQDLGLYDRVIRLPS